MGQGPSFRCIIPSTMGSWAMSSAYRCCCSTSSNRKRRSGSSSNNNNSYVVWCINQSVQIHQRNSWSRTCATVADSSFSKKISSVPKYKICQYTEIFVHFAIPEAAAPLELVQLYTNDDETEKKHVWRMESDVSWPALASCFTPLLCK